MDSGLYGMKAIAQFMGKSENTILKYVREYDFPATKIAGEWVSDRDEIARWRREQIHKYKSGAHA